MDGNLDHMNAVPLAAEPLLRVGVVSSMLGPALVLLGALAAASMSATQQIDLMPFGRVVQFEGNSPETLEARTLKRGADGWQAWKDERGEYNLGLTWDEPRDVAEICLEYHDAFAQGDRIRVEYFYKNWPNLEVGGWAPIDDPFHGQWQNIPLQNAWLGERGATLPFASLNTEPQREVWHGERYRRTYHIRLLWGTNAPPPITAIRVHGLQPEIEGEFELRIDRASSIHPPFEVSAVNGDLLDARGDAAQPVRLQSAEAKLRVRYFRVDVDTPTRTIVTVRSAADPLCGFSFLPEEARSRGVISLPALGATVTSLGGGPRRWAALTPGMSITDRVEREPEQTFVRARNEIPVLNKRGQRERPMYQPLGPPEARQEIAVNYDGSVLLHESALKTPGTDSKRLRWPAKVWYLRLATGEPPFDQSAEGVVRQQLLEGYLPILVNSWETGGVRYEQISVASFLDGEPPAIKGDETVVLLSRLHVSNVVDTNALAIVRLQTEPGERLEADRGHVSATAPSGEKWEPYSEARYRFFARADQGELKIAKPADALQKQTARWECLLAPGESRTFEFRVPFVTIDTQAERAHIATLDFDRVLAAEAKRWRQMIAQQAVIEVPDLLLSDFYKATLAHILITADREPESGRRILPAGTFLYGVCLNESCHQIRALEMRGLHDTARQYLDSFVAEQSRWGMNGRFTDKTGVLGGGGPYNLDHGFGLWMLNEHYRFTRDRAWLAQTAPALIAACDFITRQRSKAPQADLVHAGDLRWGLGLLPPGHLEDPPEWHRWFAVNAYACRGLMMTADSLKEIGHPQAARIDQEANSFRETLRDSCREAMIRAPVVRLRDGTYVPHQPTRSRLRGRDVGWVRDGLYGPIHLIDCGVYADNSPEAGWILRDMEDNVFIGAARGRTPTDFDDQWFSWGGITIQANLLPNPLVYVRRGQPKMALRAFYNTLATFSYDDVRTFCEHPVDFLGLGEGPFYKAPDESAFMAWFRSLLLCENGPDLEVLPAVPLAWLEDGKQIRVRNAATWFGPISLEIASRGNRLEISLELPTRNPPREARLHIRRPGRITKVIVNGRPASKSQLAADVVVLPGSTPGSP
jgi:hypothetical protein